MVREPEGFYHCNSRLRLPKILLLVSEIVWVSAGKSWTQKAQLNEWEGKKSHGSSDGARAPQLQQQAGSVARASGQARQPEELLEQLPVDLSSRTNFHVKKRT